MEESPRIREEYFSDGGKVSVACVSILIFKGTATTVNISMMSKVVGINSPYTRKYDNARVTGESIRGKSTMNWLRVERRYIVIIMDIMKAANVLTKEKRRVLLMSAVIDI